MGGWWGSWKVAGGGVLVTQLIHELDLLLLVMGQRIGYREHGYPLYQGMSQKTMLTQRSSLKTGPQRAASHLSIRVDWVGVLPFKEAMGRSAFPGTSQLEIAVLFLKP